MWTFFCQCLTNYYAITSQLIWFFSPQTPWFYESEWSTLPSALQAFMMAPNQGCLSLMACWELRNWFCNTLRERNYAIVDNFWKILQNFQTFAGSARLGKQSLCAPSTLRGHSTNQPKGGCFPWTLNLDTYSDHFSQFLLTFVVRVQ